VGQPVEQRSTEAALIDGALQVLVGGRDDAHVDVARRGTDGLDLLALQRAQQERLERQAAGPDLVQEQRAAFGLSEVPQAAAVGAGERALGVAEELAGGGGLRQGCQADGDQGAGAAGELVQGLGHQLLAGPGQTPDEHRVGGGTQGADGRPHVGQVGAGSDQAQVVWVPGVHPAPHVHDGAAATQAQHGARVQLRDHVVGPGQSVDGELQARAVGHKAAARPVQAQAHGRAGAALVQQGRAVVEAGRGA
jgi:hypothetical protein